MKLNRLPIWISLSALVILGMFLSITLGSVAINWPAIFEGEGLLETEQIIVAELRLPRMIAALIGGAALALAGLLMQTLFRNPLAGPSVLGISSGSSLAVAFVTLGGGALASHPFLLVGSSMVGALVVLAIIAYVANRFYDIASVLIVGVMLSFFTSALIGVLQSQATDQDLKAFVIWGFGSFGGLRLSQLPFFILPISFIVLASPFLSKQLNAYLLGAEHAQSLGIAVSRLRLISILMAGMLTAIVTAFCGPIAFIGLAGPHIARIVFRTSDHRLILPASLLVGGVLGLYCDVIARMPGSDSALPLNTVCSFIGAPIVIFLLIRQRKKSISW